MRRLLPLVAIHNLRGFGLACICVLSWSCGGGGSSTGPPPPPPPTITSVTVGASGSQVLAGQTFVFTVSVQGTGAFSSAVTWAVNGATGGNAQTGTISGGTYIAPASLPATNPITVTATSVVDSTKSGSATATVGLIVIAPANPSIQYGQTQQFTATVTGFSSPTVQWSALAGQISSTGLYTAPVPGSDSTQDTVSASVVTVQGTVSTTFNFIAVTPKLDSISPNPAMAGQRVTLITEGMYNVKRVYFTAPTGDTIDAAFSPGSATATGVTVPLGVASAPLFMQYTDTNGNLQTTNSVTFNRIPNLHIRAQNIELSSGETTQLLTALLGGTTTSSIAWTADQGTIDASGLYQAPSVSAETYPTITGCLTGTVSCDSVMVHVQPFRISPSVPIVAMGGTLQLTAIQGGAQISPTWSLPAANGSISTAGLYTAPTTALQAGPAPVSATSGGYTAKASIAVTGAGPGLVNRLWDYRNLNSPGNVGMSTRSVAVSGNRAYALDTGAPYSGSSYHAIDTYDITNPQQPVWVSAADCTTATPSQTFISGNNLVLVESGPSFPPTSISIYDIQSGTPILASYVDLPNFQTTELSNGIVYGLPPQTVSPGSSALTVYKIDPTSGSDVQSKFELTAPGGMVPTMIAGVTGAGNMIYLLILNPDGSSPLYTIAAYDVSTSTPTLFGSFQTDNVIGPFQLVNGLLFVGPQSYDVSTPNFTPVANVPMNVVDLIQGNQVLGFGFSSDYEVMNITNPAALVIADDVLDLASEQNGSFAAWAGSNTVIAADNSAGLSVFDVSVPGGPNKEANPFDEETGAQLNEINDQVIQSQTLYAAGVAENGNSGGLATYDVSGTSPSFLGRLLYSGETGLAVQAAGSYAFLGLTDTLKVVNVSNPSSPSEAASIVLPTNALLLAGNALFVGTSDSRLVVFNVSNPTAPQQLASVSIPGPPITMRVSGSLLFIADAAKGLLIYDVSTPAAPVRLSQYTLPVPVWDVAPTGTMALLAADAQGLVVLDVSNPAQANSLSQTPLPPYDPFSGPGGEGTVSTATAIALQNGVVYVGTSTDNPSATTTVAGFDFTQPTVPRLVSLQNRFGFGISAVTPLGSELFLGINAIYGISVGVVDQFDNSFPYNSIELYNPPPALAQTLQSQNSVKRLATDSNPKLSRNPTPLIRPHRMPIH